MEDGMDRRQRKTRDAIFAAFIKLLGEKNYNQITVGEIIDGANVGRATFYAHFETKDYLLKELCEELFCHIFDATEDGHEHHSHIFECDAPSSVILHLFQHLQKNDNNILELLSSENNELFLRYFKENLKHLILRQLHLFYDKKPPALPLDCWVNHICATLVETLRWWIANGKKESPELLADYFLMAI